ncbi:MAG TPA: hypothetical protein VNM16_04845, partial [Bacillota bacterium]|nr:hypothetical protein [Bacillota bacterium]
LLQRGCRVRKFLDDRTDQPLVFGWMPALAIYADDPDGHLVEFLAMLDGPPRPGAGVVPLVKWGGIGAVGRPLPPRSGPCA